MARRSNSKPAWQATWLWKTLESRKAKDSPHASEIISILEGWMEKLETVLRSGNTVPLDFTLHDDRHAIRVAKRMEELIPLAVRKNISDYEIALLLLAAYGHDVGMAPERGKVTALRNHLFSPSTTTLSEDESGSFQKFLDEYTERPVQLPLDSSPANLALADELLTYYVRDRHNDWSAEWLMENLTPKGFKRLPDAVGVLIRLCASHHWDFERLRCDDFNPIFSSGAQTQIIHLRYLACILRMADILENDPERTPVVLLRHRDIAERRKSLVHWQKDHAFTIDLLSDGQIRFHARPPDAHVHRALLDLAGWIDHELQGIAAFGESLPTEKKIGTKTIRRDWHLAPALTPDITPADGSYEYIDGAFRPNTGRLLQLLSGEQLYENSLHAVRELLQNAFDAVREKIARRRIEARITDPSDRKWEKILGDQEQVSLTLRPGDNGEWFLICEDSGVGLTKDLITGHLLVSGNGRRHAVLDLERRCAEKGFHPALTGQFGIGVLSYFMLAEEVLLETTRYQGCGDGVENWHFTTRGVGSFGELRKPTASPFLDGGTRIQWTLRKDRIENPGDFAKKLIDYLKATLVRIPCRFTFKTVGITDSEQFWSCETGWTMSQDNWRDLSMSRWLEPEAYSEREISSSKYPSEEERAALDDQLASYPQKLIFARESLHCETREIKIASVGVARLILCWFELEHGRSLVFPPERPDIDLFPIIKANVRAWKGMSLGRVSRSRVSDNSRNDLTLTVEIDFEEVDRTQLSINRNGVQFPDAAEKTWIDQIWRIGNEWIDEILSSGSGDHYNEINQNVRSLPLTLVEGRAWYFQDTKCYLSSLPSTFASLPHDIFSPLHCRTQTGTPIPFIRLRNEELVRVNVGFRIAAFSGMFPGLGSGPRTDIVLYHRGEEKVADAETTLFPNEWKGIALVELLGDTILLNSDNTLVQLLSREQRLNIIQSSISEDLLATLDAAKSPGDFACVLLKIARRVIHNDEFHHGVWTRYSMERSEHLISLWKELADETQTTLTQLCVGALNSFWQVQIRATPPESEDMIKKARQIFPSITDPDFLLFEQDEK